MKQKLLLFSFFLVLGTVAQAQSFEFRYHGNIVPNGNTVTIEAAEDDFGDLSCETNPVSNPTNGLMLQLLSGTSASFSATMEIEHNTLNATTVQWCMGGECMPFSNTTKFTKNFTVDNNEQVQFDAYDIKDKGYLMAKLTLTRSFETQTIYIQFTNDNSAGIGAMHDANGQMLNDHVFYDLSGRRVEYMTKGLYIVGGKKVVIK